MGSSFGQNGGTKSLLLHQPPPLPRRFLSPLFHSPSLLPYYTTRSLLSSSTPPLFDGEGEKRGKGEGHSISGRNPLPRPRPSGLTLFPSKKPPSSHLVSLSPFLTHFLRAGGDEKMGRRRRRCKVLKLTRVVVVVACGGKKREEKG